MSRRTRRKDRYECLDVAETLWHSAGPLVFRRNESPTRKRAAAQLKELGARWTRARTRMAREAAVPGGSNTSNQSKEFMVEPPQPESEADETLSSEIRSVKGRQRAPGRKAAPQKKRKVRVSLASSTATDSTEIVVELPHGPEPAKRGRKAKAAQKPVPQSPVSVASASTIEPPSTAKKARGRPKTKQPDAVPEPIVPLVLTEPEPEPVDVSTVDATAPVPSDVDKTPIPPPRKVRRIARPKPLPEPKISDEKRTRESPRNFVSPSASPKISEEQEPTHPESSVAMERDSLDEHEHVGRTDSNSTVTARSAIRFLAPGKHSSSSAREETEANDASSEPPPPKRQKRDRAQPNPETTDSSVHTVTVTAANAPAPTLPSAAPTKPTDPFDTLKEFTSSFRRPQAPAHADKTFPLVTPVNTALPSIARPSPFFHFDWEPTPRAQLVDQFRSEVESVPVPPDTFSQLPKLPKLLRGQRSWSVASTRLTSTIGTAAGVETGLVGGDRPAEQSVLPTPVSVPSNSAPAYLANPIMSPPASPSISISLSSTSIALPSPIRLPQKQKVEPEPLPEKENVRPSNVRETLENLRHRLAILKGRQSYKPREESPGRLTISKLGGSNAEALSVLNTSFLTAEPLPRIPEEVKPEEQVPVIAQPEPVDQYPNPLTSPAPSQSNAQPTASAPASPPPTFAANTLPSSPFGRLGSIAEPTLFATQLSSIPFSSPQRDEGTLFMHSPALEDEESMAFESAPESPISAQGERSQPKETASKDFNFDFNQDPIAANFVATLPPVMEDDNSLEEAQPIGTANGVGSKQVLPAGGTGSFIPRASGRPLLSATVVPKRAPDDIPALKRAAQAKEKERQEQERREKLRQEVKAKKTALASGQGASGAITCAKVGVKTVLPKPAGPPSAISIVQAKLQANNALTAKGLNRPEPPPMKRAREDDNVPSENATPDDEAEQTLKKARTNLYTSSSGIPSKQLPTKVTATSVAPIANPFLPATFAFNASLSKIGGETPESITDLHGGEIPEIDSGESSSDEAPPRPSWANTPNVKQALLQHQNTNPEAIFGAMKTTIELDEVFRPKRKGKFRPRSSSAHWVGTDKLTQDEVGTYNKDMGFSN
ncbi:hypothetical protein M427DRAFT_144454 [Gonapodya prolifera JEL478]|uniref:Inner centromere protein ARK-binding domain-containing protein n=1 Tax=Gonapodya prolifera (strain JEL478) TaxID=1344416 RepID=A0A139AKB0_GONPJ|nr:hypothetical protein M427DRAFT_144454 [Gonapodya prolifera JEL478]|eukprot:KXS17221.1 hypothetical protein M427DRAFT_144454 [Gonapodya prolifera JEL478]